MSDCASPPRSTTTSTRGYPSLHRPTIVAPGASYEVETSCRSTLHSAPVRIHAGALGGILAPASMSLAQAAERLHDLLRPLTKTEFNSH